MSPWTRDPVQGTPMGRQGGAHSRGRPRGHSVFMSGGAVGGFPVVPLFGVLGARGAVSECRFLGAQLWHRIAHSCKWFSPKSQRAQAYSECINWRWFVCFSAFILFSAFNCSVCLRSVPPRANAHVGPSRSLQAPRAHYSPLITHWQTEPSHEIIKGVFAAAAAGQFLTVSRSGCSQQTNFPEMR